MEQLSLFAPDPDAVSAAVKSAGDRPVRMTVLIVVKAAPNPSARYGETVCVAGIRLDLEHPGWVRLYPINFRELDEDASFKKYDVVSVEARPSHGDSRTESWRPLMDTLVRQKHLREWPHRAPYIADHIADSMCGLIAGVRERPPARSLAAIRPVKVAGIDIVRHPGWTRAEQAKIDGYVSQLELPGMERGPRTALEAPRFKGWYRYICSAPACPGHRQGIYDWEWVALQRNPALKGRSDDDIKAALREKFFTMMCAPDRDLLLFVGNLAKRQQAFMVLGAFYPRR